jgi:vacuolar-type H+-ATPase subunit H
MNIPAASQTKCEPLEKIRHAELDVSHQIAVARKSAEGKIADANFQANMLKEKAKEDGSIAGQKAAEEYLAQIQLEVSKMIAQAQVQSEKSFQRALEDIDSAVEFAVMFVIGLKAKGEKK